MFFKNLKVRFFLRLVGSIVKNMERIKTRKGNTNIFQCSKSYDLHTI